MVQNISNELKQTPGYDPRYSDLVSLPAGEIGSDDFDERSVRSGAEVACSKALGVDCHRERVVNKQKWCEAAHRAVWRFVARLFSRRISGRLCWSGARPATTLGN
jgi:hypothetical protein